MNKVAILTRLSGSKVWIQFSIFIIVIVFVVKILFELSSIIFNPDDANKAGIKVVKEKLALINRKSAELSAIERRLPALSAQTKYALEYFEIYGLILKEVAEKSNNQQKFQIQGQLAAVILAIYDVKFEDFLVQFNKIVINGKNAVVDIIIFGNSNE